VKFHAAYMTNLETVESSQQQQCIIKLFARLRNYVIVIEQLLISVDKLVQKLRRHFTADTTVQNSQEQRDIRDDA